MSKANKNGKDKGGAKVSFRSMIIAMIVALLGFLGFGGLELGNGDGADVDAGNENVVVSEAEEENTKSLETEQSDENVFEIYVRESDILISTEASGENLEAVSLEAVEGLISGLDSDVRVIIYDDGAINKTYEDVIELVDNSGLRKSEEKASN